MAKKNNSYNPALTGLFASMTQPTRSSYRNDFNGAALNRATAFSAPAWTSHHKFG